MRDMKYDIARSVAMIWVVGIYHLSEYLFSPLHELQWARMVTWGCLGTFTFISAYFLAGKNDCGVARLNVQIVHLLATSLQYFRSQ